MNSFLQKKILPFLLLVLISMVSHDAAAQLIGWNANSTGGGFGNSPWTPATTNTNLITSGLIRGSAITTSGTAAASCWGGSGGWNATGTDANSFYVTFQAKPGFVMNISGITSATRRSNSGPASSKVSFSVNGGAFINAGTWNTSVTSGTTGSPNSTTLSGVSALQNIAAGVEVKIRITPQGTTGNYYLTGAANALRITGTVTAAAAPAITPSLTALNSFGDVIVGTESGPKTFTFTAADMGTNDISISAPDHFQISTDNANWYPGTDISPVSGVLPSTMVWVRFKPTATGNKTGDITLSADGAVTKTVSVSGNAIDGIAIVPSSIENLNYPQGQGPSLAVQPAKIITSGLVPSAGTILFALAAGSNYEIAGADMQWGDSALLPYVSADNVMENPAVYIHLKSGLAEGNIPAEVINVSGGGLATSFTVSGMVTIGALDAPVATNATAIGDTGFTASWNTVPGALEYRLDVSASAAFDTFVGSYNDMAVSGTSKAITQLLPNTAYFYRVRAKAFSVVSPHSNVIEAKTNCQMVALPSAVAHVLCAPATVEDLSATMIPGSVLKWYDDAVALTPLNLTDILSSKSYFVSQTLSNGCESQRLEVSVTIKPKPDAPVAVAQQFCTAGTIGELLPKQPAPGYNQVTETFADPNWGNRLNYTGVYTLATGDWNARNVGRISTGSNDPNKRIYLSSGNASVSMPPYMISPPFSGIKTVVVQAASPVSSSQLEVIKIVNGIESVIQTLTVPVSGTLAMSTFTVNVNDNSDGIRIKISGKTGVSHSIAIGDMTLTYETETAGIRWYDGATGGLPLAESAALQTQNYYVSQIVNGCESERAEVAVTVTPIPDAPIASNQSFCVEGTVADLTAAAIENAVLKWYDDAVTASVLDGNTALSAKSYFVSQVSNGCESARTEITVTLESQVIPLFDSIAAICAGETLMVLPTTSTNGITGSWSPALDNMATTEYTFTPNATECAQIATLTITVNSTSKPTGTETQDYTQGDTLAGFAVTGQNIKWYDAPSGGNELAETTLISAPGATYYASQTISGCESGERLKIIAGQDLGITESDQLKIILHPNPVKDMLKIDAGTQIRSVSIFTVLGQLILQKDVHSNHAQIDLSHLAPGNYIVRLNGNQSVKTFKIIKV